MISLSITGSLRLLVFICFASLSTILASKGEIRHISTNKEFIGRFDEGEFEVVHPFQIRDKNDRIGIDTRNYYLNGTAHYKQVTIVIRSNVVGRLKLLLTLNELIFVNDTEFRKLDEQGDSPVSSIVEKCYYQGTVNGDESTFVALSSCNGLRGIIAFGNGSSFGVWPLEGGDRGRRHPHVFYRTKWSADALCGTQSGELARRSRRFLRRRDVTRQTKYVEVSLIADYSFMKEHDLSDYDATSFMLEAINIADLMFSRDLNVRISAVYVEEWMDAERVDVHADIERTLSGLVEYVTGHLYHIAKDGAIMFTREKFANTEVTSSTFGSVCTARAAAIVSAIDIFTVHDTGQVLAQSIAHLMGIEHDSPDCSCDTANRCVMARQIGSPGASFAWQFSRCSIARMHSVLQSGHLQCLLNRPLQASSLRECGNGVVDGEEECDCGSREECFDPCCDPLTCTLRAHAQCAAHQPCCHRCQLRPTGHVCRASRSVCDVAEVCNGEDGNCPIDGYLVDGTVCGINGQCWKGNCSDLEQQCRDLWGEDSTVANEHCFERNELGVEYGNCGEDREGNFRKCASENVRCGTLQCKGGGQAPRDDRLNSFNLHFLHEAKQIQCKTVTQIGFGMVWDGANCGSGKVCVQGICLPLTQASPPVHCPSNNLALQCSGHGDCTTSLRCLCFDGWAGIACDTRSNSSRRAHLTTPSPSDILIPSLASGRSLNTTTLLAILLLVGVILLVLLVCLLFCYRRRSAVEFPDVPADEKLNESIPENTERAIKFGNMPSYREEKRKRKKNKRVYDALHRITEATEERDSVSLKSRESNSVCNALENSPESVVICPDTPAGYAPHDSHIMARMIATGSGGSILKKESSASRCLFNDGEVYGESCSEILGSPTLCSALGRRAASRYDRARSGYATDSELGMSPYAHRYVDALCATRLDLSPTLSQSSSSRMAPTPLKLNNIGMLLRQLQYNDEMTSDAELSAVEADHMDHIDLGSNTESSRGFETHESLKFSPNGDLIDVYESRLASSSSYENQQRSPGFYRDLGPVGVVQPSASRNPRCGSRSNFEVSSAEKETIMASEKDTGKRLSEEELRKAQSSAVASHETSCSQSPSLFSDTFRLEV